MRKCFKGNGEKEQKNVLRSRKLTFQCHYEQHSFVFIRGTAKINRTGRIRKQSTKQNLHWHHKKTFWKHEEVTFQYHRRKRWETIYFLNRNNEAKQDAFKNQNSRLYGISINIKDTNVSMTRKIKVSISHRDRRDMLILSLTVIANKNQTPLLSKQNLKQREISQGFHRSLGHFQR